MNHPKDFAKYSPNPEVNRTILNLLDLGCPPIPVAPQKDPRDPGYHRVDFSQSYRISFYCDANGEEVAARSYCLNDRLQRITGDLNPISGKAIENWNDRGVFCPLDANLQPIPKFTGKNPSYLTKSGEPRICKHGEFQKRIPSKQELKKFFRHPDTGVGTLGGHAGVDWLDFDAKNFESQEECDRSLWALIDEKGLENSWIERTGSGGWRIAVRPKQHPTFTNFALTPGGKHIGEALWEGRFTVLAGSIHPNGNPYRRIGWDMPIEVESLEAIGIYPSKDEVEQQEQKEKQKQKKADNPNYGEPSNPSENPWDIRNFAIYFEGYYEDKEWGYAKCPHHNGTSMRSFRVNLTTGQYKLHCGCDTKAVFKSGLELAKSKGYYIPKKPLSNFRTVRETLAEFLETFPELESQAGKDWLKMREFTPDYTIDAQYFDWESDKPGINLAVKSGLNTGKTQHIHETFLADKNKGAIASGYRNALLVQFNEKGKKIGGKPWYHLQTDLKQSKSKEDMLLLSDPQSRISTCIDSLIHFQPQHFEGKRAVFDEIEGTFKHLYQAKTAVSFYRHICKQRIGEAIANAEAVALLDGNLTDLSVAHAERISGKKFTKVENIYQGNRGKVYFYTGTQKLKKDEETGEFVVAERKVNDWSLLHKMMMEDTEPFVCGCDSQEKLEAWDNLLKAKGIKTFRLDGSNSTENESKNFLKNPAEYIKKHRVRVVLYSPTAESGLSIELKGYFKRGYFFFFGVVYTNEQTQFLARVRDPQITTYVFCQAKGQNCRSQESTSSDLQKYFLEYTLACSKISLSNLPDKAKEQQLRDEAEKLIKLSNNAHFQYECHLKAREVFESNHLRQCLEYALREAGYQVEVVTGYKASQKELAAAREAVQIQKSQEIFAANTIDEYEAREKSQDADASRQDKIEIVKHNLLSRLPGIENKFTEHTKVVSIPAEAASEITQGRVPLEIAQTLGFSIPEMPTTHAVEVWHLPLDSLNDTAEGASASEPCVDSENSAQNPGESTPETAATQAVEVRHLPPNLSIKPVEGASVSKSGEVQFQVTEKRPVFDAEFVRKVKFQDRALISEIELYFLLKNPQIAKLLQERKWYKKLRIFSDLNAADCAKPIDLTTYKSDWLKVHTLLEMGIEFFLNPESRWTQDSPEALDFWEKGKAPKIARFIGTTVGDSKPCEYIGRVLAKLDVKTKSEKVRNEQGEQQRVYRVNEDYLTSPIRQSIYESVAERIAGKLQEAPLNWNLIGSPPKASPQSPPISVVEPSQLSLDFSIKPAEDASEKLGQNLAESTSDTLATQAVEVRHLPPDSLNKIAEGASEHLAPKPEVRSWHWSELPLVRTVLKWIDRSEQVRLLALEANGSCQVRSLLTGLITNTRIDQLMPLPG